MPSALNGFLIRQRQVISADASAVLSWSSSFYFDLAINDCKKVGFRKIVLRGDTDFSSTEHLDRWDSDGVYFIFGYDANKTVSGIADD